MIEKTGIPYYSLHCHSDYSSVKFPDSICKVSDLINTAHDMGLSGIAITDHDMTSSYIQIEKHMNKMRKANPDDETWKNFKVIRGNEIYLVRNGLNKDNYDRRKDKYFHFILLAKNRVGCQQIMEISARAWKRSYMYFHRRVPTYWKDLEEIIGDARGNVIASSACLGSQVNQLILEKNNLSKDELHYVEQYDEVIDKWINKIVEIFGKENFFLELQPAKYKEQIIVNKELIKLGKKHGLKCILTTDVHYLTNNDRKIHKTYLNSKSGEREVDDFYEATYLMTSEEIISRMKSYLEIHEIVELIENTRLIGEQCEEYSLEKPLHLPYLPTNDQDTDDINEEILDLMPELASYLSSDEPADNQMGVRIYNFIKDDLWKNEKKRNRIERELEIITDSSNKNGVHWSKYLLQVADYVNIFWTKGDSIVAPSRGSVGASYVAFILDIIQVDPTEEKVNLVFERFLNPDRASVLDIDIDVQSDKRGQCIAALQDTYGYDNVVRVSTFKTEKAKSAILKAAKGCGYDIDESRFLASLVKSERGIQYTLSEMYYGDEEKEIKPDSTFIKEMNKYSDVWEVAKRIEGLVTAVGVHAGGVVIVDHPLTEVCSLTATTTGEIVTAFDLHDAEEVGLIKIDSLATEGLTKIRTTLDLLLEYGYIEYKDSLREIYESTIGLYNGLKRDEPEMWKMVENNEIISLFQMTEQSGIQGISLTKPKSVEELALLNSAMRLMSAERGAEQPLEKFARFKEDPSLWDKEMDSYGLTEEDKKVLHDILDYSYGICAHQEDIYQLVTHPKIAGWSWGHADLVRRAVAKKIIDDFTKLENEFLENARENEAVSESLAKYAWNLTSTQRGYSFNLAHTLSYSLIGLQQMNLAYYYPLVFWNTANLIVDSGAKFYIDDEEELSTDASDEIEVNETEEVEDDSFSINRDDDDDDEDEEVSEKTGGATKRKPTVVSYDKIAAAIGKMQTYGITVLPPNINRSSKTFTPNVETNTIHYGLQGIVKLNEQIVDEILAKRPFSSIDDFLDKIKANKPQVVNLIKSGAFDDFGDRTKLMKEYIASISGAKKRLTLQNVNGLIQNNLFPDELDEQAKTFLFNKEIRKTKGDGYLYFDQKQLKYYSERYDVDFLQNENDKVRIKETTWKSIYDKEMNILRNYIKENQDELLEKLNANLIAEFWDKYASGTIESWSMDSVSFYQDRHELDDINFDKYGISRFANLPQEPEVAYTFTAKKTGQEISMYKLSKIAGTVISRDKMKNLIMLLTTDGVVPVKAYGVMPYYDKQISVVLPSGKKRVVEKSFFTRGYKIVVQGMRRGDVFYAKKYKNSSGHHFERIINISENGDLELHNRGDE